MAKKYLLYIHHDKFEAEEEKSKLVNALLDKHYGGRMEGNIVRHTAMPGTTDPVSGLEVDEFRENTPEVDKLLSSLYEPAIKFCKHNAVLGLCKKGCR